MSGDGPGTAVGNGDSGRGGRGGRSERGSRQTSARSGGSGRSLLIEFLDKTVSVVTNDGRVIIGRLRGFDQVSNLVMDKCVERVFAETAGVESIDHGVYVLRGDNISAVGEVDSERDSAIKWEDIKCAPLDPVVH